MKNLFLLVPLLCIFSSCNRSAPLIADWDSYILEYESWQESRLERLKGENGWLNLAGLLWLEEGENTFGSELANHLVFPENFPANGGLIILEDSTLTLKVNEGTEIFIEGRVIQKTLLKHDQDKDKSIMEHGQYRWFILKRGERYAIRLRDLQHPRIQQLDHIPSYPFNKDYVILAELSLFDSAKTIEVPSAISGYNEFYKAPGELQFKLNGKSQTLLPFKSGDGYFIIVGDETNGMETYGAGRFLYAEHTDETHVLIDFNKATNPPCAFSPFATCPLPPLENILNIEIEAGEKAVHLE